MPRFIRCLFLLALAVSCQTAHEVSRCGTEYAEWFSVADSMIVTISPSDGSCDTLIVDKPYRSVVCMSSTQVACLSQIGASDCICGVSGMRYITDSLVRGSGRAVEVGDLDYERVISIPAEILCASGQGGADYGRLEDFGIKVIHIYDYMENHPLARAEYIRLFGALTGRMAEADSIFRLVKQSYLETAEMAAMAAVRPVVLVNAPYRDAWYVPGRDGYFTRLVQDAGAEVAGALPGTASSIMTVEKAFSLASEADFWIHPGWAASLDELRSSNPLFGDFAVLSEGRVFNNTLRINDGGGNDYYESGSVRPDLVLQDLAAIFHPDLFGEKNNVSREGLHYYIELH